MSEYYIVQGGELELYLFPKEDFEKFFDFADDDDYASVNLSKHQCNNPCQCKRWSSYVINHLINHVKSTYKFGTAFPTNYVVLGIFMLRGNIF